MGVPVARTAVVFAVEIFRSDRTVIMAVVLAGREDFFEEVFEVTLDTAFIFVDANRRSCMLRDDRNNPIAEASRLHESANLISEVDERWRLRGFEDECFVFDHSSYASLARDLRRSITFLFRRWCSTDSRNSAVLDCSGRTPRLAARSSSLWTASLISLSGRTIAS